MSSSWLVHNLFMTCLQLVETCLSLVYDLFITCSLLVYVMYDYLFITCSQILARFYLSSTIFTYFHPIWPTFHIFTYFHQCSPISPISFIFSSHHLFWPMFTCHHLSWPNLTYLDLSWLILTYIDLYERFKAFNMIMHVLEYSP